MSSAPGKSGFMTKFSKFMFLHILIIGLFPVINLKPVL